MSSLSERYHALLEKIARSTREITLVAVSKTHSIEKIEELYRLGHRDFGENYVQELLPKAEALAERGCSDIRWHFIGHLQTNKIKSLLPAVSCIQSVDSVKLAEQLNQRWSDSGRGGKLPVFIEVNVDGEASKTGLRPDQVPALATQITQTCDGLELLGLMCVPARDQESEALRQAFRRLRVLDLGLSTRHRLSMGMSDDFELAIAEGATHIRVGTALFGPRSG